MRYCKICDPLKLMANPEHFSILRQGVVVGLTSATALLLLVLKSTLLVVPSMGAEAETFSLSLRMQDVYNPDLEIHTDLEIDKPFQILTNNGTVKNTISGVLYRPRGKRYRLRLKISEWQSEAQNSTETFNFTLELDKPWSGGAIQSTVFRRTVTLSRQKK